MTGTHDALHISRKVVIPRYQSWEEKYKPWTMVFYIIVHKMWRAISYWLKSYHVQGKLKVLKIYFYASLRKLFIIQFYRLVFYNKYVHVYRSVYKFKINIWHLVYIKRAFPIKHQLNYIKIKSLTVTNILGKGLQYILPFSLWKWKDSSKILQWWRKRMMVMVRWQRMMTMAWIIYHSTWHIPSTVWSSSRISRRKW